MPHWQGGDQDALAGAPLPRDAELAGMLEKAAKEAQEQVHYHTSQLRMWGRVSGAAQAGLDALHADGPQTEESAFHVEGRRY
jgi:hypothetical protein